MRTAALVCLAGLWVISSGLLVASGLALRAASRRRLVLGSRLPRTAPGAAASSRARGPSRQHRLVDHQPLTGRLLPGYCDRDNNPSESGSRVRCHDRLTWRCSGPACGGPLIFGVSRLRPRRVQGASDPTAEATGGAPRVIGRSFPRLPRRPRRGILCVIGGGAARCRRPPREPTGCRGGSANKALQRTPLRRGR